MRRPDRRFVGLLLLTVVPAAVEAWILTGLGFIGGQGVAPQVTAVWPYDIYHDLRWVLGYHYTWAGFVVEFAALILFRGLLSASIVYFAWPERVPRPAYHRLVVRNTLVAVGAAVLVSPWAALSVATGVLALSWYYFASLIGIFLMAPFLQRAGAVSGWWRGLPSLELVGWSLLNFVVLTIAGAFIWSTPDWLNGPAAIAVGIANGLLWKATVHAAVLPRRLRWRRVPVAPLVVVLITLAPVAARAITGPTTEVQAEWQPPIFQRRLPDTVKHALILIVGHDSTYGGEQAVDPNVEQFSYRGLSADGKPLPYGSRSTHQSLESSVDLLAAQVDEIHRRTKRPVALLGQSEGSLVVRLFLQRHPGSPVDTVLLFSPLVRAGRSYYPPPDAHTGWGLLAGWELRGVFLVTNLTTKTKDNPDEPFVRSILDNAPFYRNRTLCPVPGVRMIAFIPTSTATEAPPAELSHIPVYQLPAFHGGLLGRPVVANRTVDYLGGQELNRTQREFTFLQRLAAAWQAPPLLASLNPVWRDKQEPVPAVTGKVCQPR